MPFQCKCIVCKRTYVFPNNKGKFCTLRCYNKALNDESFPVERFGITRMVCEYCGEKFLELHGRKRKFHTKECKRLNNWANRNKKNGKQ